MNQNSNMYEILGKLNSISSPVQQPKAETKTQLQESAQHSQSQSPYDRLNEKYQNFIYKIPFYNKYNGYFYTTPEI